MAGYAKQRCETRIQWLCGLARRQVEKPGLRYRRVSRNREQIHSLALPGIPIARRGMILCKQIHTLTASVVIVISPLNKVILDWGKAGKTRIFTIVSAVDVVCKTI